MTQQSHNRAPGVQERRAAFRVRWPGGYLWQDEEIRMDPDERVQETIRQLGCCLTAGRREGALPASIPAGTIRRLPTSEATHGAQEPPPPSHERRMATCTITSGSKVRTAWAAPWAGEYEWKASDNRVYEYACHEGNYAMGNILRGARLLEAEYQQQHGARSVSM